MSVPTADLEAVHAPLPALADIEQQLGEPIEGPSATGGDWHRLRHLTWTLATTDGCAEVVILRSYGVRCRVRVGRTSDPGTSWG